MASALVSVSKDGQRLKGQARRSNSDGSKSASELYDATGVIGAAEADLQKGSLPWEPIEEVDKKDLGTPDQWIPRHPDLIRLTGRYARNILAGGRGQ